MADRPPHPAPDGDAPADDGASRRPRAWVGLLALTLVTAALLAVVEGVASWIVFVDDVATLQESVRTAEESHAVFDADIGWVSRPGVTVEGLYGPGTSLNTDERGFRGRGPVSTTVPDGVHRVLCSGDSFTLGYGVNDDETWCALLGDRPGTASVNLGQGGYGIGQAFLWYRRAAADLDRSVHVLAFVGDDFRRLGVPHFLGFEKPLVRAVEGVPTAVNVPVEERGATARWLTVNGHLFTRLATIRLARALARRVGLAGEPAEGPVDGGATPDEATWDAAVAIFDALVQENADRGAELLLVFLPSPWDYRQDLYAPWRERVAAYARERGVAYVDLIDDLRALPAERVAGLFFPDDAPGAHHFTVPGNRWAADRLAPVVDSLAAATETDGR